MNGPMEVSAVTDRRYRNSALVAVRKDRRRVEVLRDASRQLRTFKPE